MSKNEDVKKAEAGFMAKMKKVFGLVPFARHALAMYYAMLDPDVPAWAKATIAAALVYFIVPLDAIPDWIIPLGYADDGAVVMGALKSVAIYVDDTHYAKADGWLGRAGCV
jgi:uncharacterized membrane protein YkvA (DUF1232 family)